MSEYIYAFKRDRKTELITKACAQNGLKRRDANCMTLEKLCEVVDEPYVPLRVLPKPSHRRPLPVRKWLVPKEYKIFIVMSKPFECQYKEWETKGDPKDTDEFYDTIGKQMDVYDKCPKVKWVKTFQKKYPEKRLMLFMSPLKWNAVKDQFTDISHAVVHSPQTKIGKKSLKSFEDGEVKVLVVANSRPPFEEFPDSVWIHFDPLFHQKRYASEHYYLHTIKSEEQAWVDAEEKVPEDHVLSLDLHRLFDSDESDE